MTLDMAFINGVSFVNDFFAGRHHFDSGFSAPSPLIYSELFVAGYEHAVLCSVRDAEWVTGNPKGVVV